MMAATEIYPLQVLPVFAMALNEICGMAVGCELALFLKTVGAEEYRCMIQMLCRSLWVSEMKEEQKATEHLTTCQTELGSHPMASRFMFLSLMI